MVDEIKIAQRAIELGLISKSQLDESLKIQRDIDSLGIETKTLKEILISKNYITEQNWQEMSQNVGEYSSFDTSHKTIKMGNNDSFSKDILDSKGVPTIDGYNIVEEIGKGAMGSVYRGVQVSMERAVAIKVLDKRLSKDKNLVDRFTLEARTTARLSHENIISGIDAGITKDGIRYFVMEYVEGQSLGEILENQEKIEPMEAATILIKVADALSYAHQEGIIHRDIKPDNIIITDENIPKLCDLGLVRDFADDSRLTMEGHALGTPHYISPEQARGLRDAIDQRSDIYSLGATFYHMVTGSPPFPQKNPAVVCAMHATKPFPHPHSIDSSIPKTICKIIDKCTQKKPNKRYQDCEQIVSDLHEFLDNHSPFQDEDAKDEYEEEVEYTQDESGAPLDFVEERPVRARRVRRTSRRNVPVQTAQAEYSTSSVVVAILSLLIIILGSVFFGYQQFTKDTKVDIIPDTEVKKNVEEDLLRQVIEKVNAQIKYELINFDSKENVEDELGKYEKIKEEYESQRANNEDLNTYFFKVTSLIDSEKKRLEEFLEKEANTRYDEKIESSISDARRNLRRRTKELEHLRSLKKNYDTLLKFPVGLYFTAKGKDVQQEIDNIKITLQENLQIQEEIADKLSDNKKYKEAKRCYNEIMDFVLKDDVDYIKRKQNSLQAEYLEHQQKVFAKVRDNFRNGIDKALINGDYKKASAHLDKYKNQDYLEEIVDAEQKKLRIYIEITEQLGKSDSLKQKLKQESADSFLRGQDFNVNDASKWALGVIYINNELFDKAYDILQNQKDAEILTSYLKIKIENTTARQLFSEIEKIYKKNTRIAFVKALELKKYSDTEYYKQNSNLIRKKSNSVYQLYLNKYAVELYFKKTFTKFNESDYSFEIEYPLDSPEHLNDFFGTTDKLCGIEEYQLSSYASQPEHVFEIYWKGKVKGNLDLEVIAISNEGKSHNIGVAFFKKNESLQDLDKHLLLMNYSAQHFVMHEIYNKDNGSRYLADINKIPVGEKKCILGYVDGKVTFLRYDSKYNNIPLDTKFLEVINENKIDFKLLVRNTSAQGSISNKKLSAELKSSSGYVGLYSNSRAKFSSFKLKGSFDEDWIKKIRVEVLRNPTEYLRLAEKRETK